MNKALIFSAPSGSGKTTIVHHLLNNTDKLKFSISATTRKPRQNEVHGRDYYFLSLEEFQKQDFIETEEVYTGVHYGTLKSEVDRIWEQGFAVVFDVDVKGGLRLKEHFGDQALSVFVKAPDLEVLEERLKSRKTETDEDLETRLSKTKFEMGFEDQFDKVLINDKLETTLQNAEEIVSDFLNS